MSETPYCPRCKKHMDDWNITPYYSYYRSDDQMISKKTCIGCNSPLVNYELYMRLQNTEVSEEACRAIADRIRQIEEDPINFEAKLKVEAHLNEARQILDNLDVLYTQLIEIRLREGKSEAEIQKELEEIARRSPF
jgi:hypothetical protein